MVESIADLKNNRRKLVTDTAGAYDPLLRHIRSMCDARSQTVVMHTLADHAQPSTVC